MTLIMRDKIGSFTSAVVAHWPSIGRSSALAALKRLTEESAGRSNYYEQ